MTQFFKLLILSLLLTINCKASVILADRYYIKSVLVNVFGETANSIIDEKIIKNGAHFGGPCDVYQQIRTGKLDTDIKDQATFCLDGATGTRLALIAKNNMFRESIMSLVCEQLTQNPKTLNYVLKKTGTVYSQKPKAHQINNIVKLFNPASENTFDIGKSILQSKPLSKLSSLDQWQIIIKTLCTDISWQIL